ncbi:helicase-related protein [Methylobacterium nonmethylotrophicum]|uniref:Transcription-repair-coupling factor n=1 Tax=Methylobacterium nonmethylotrophicum TaxID=1141884 RepID=A0A4Z0NQI7_9HYPH|nr:helicase-related protein [Methylobacterium nonmethylotrophicum]TGD98607.1 DEAD/DEAH box helicase [Methylobacterium nonmethylotrophicum]
MAKRKAMRRAREGAEESVAPLVPPGALAVALLSLLGGRRPLVHVARDARRLEELAALLRGFAPGIGVAVYPEWDCLPFDRASPSRGTMGARAGVLRWLTDADNLPDIVLTTAPALIQRVPPPETWGKARVEIRAGDAVEAGRLTAELQRLGYILDDRVDEPGEVAVRGRTIDVFPAAAPRPCRIEHAGGTVTAIRTYDPVSQRSLDEVETLVVDPATEIVLEPDSPVALRPFTGQEHQLPTLYGRLATVLDYVPEAHLVVEAGAEARADAFFEQIEEGRGAKTPGAETRGVALPLYLTPAEWRRARKARELAVASDADAEAIAVPAFVRERRPGPAFSAYLRERLKAGDRVVLAGDAAALKRLSRQAARAAERGVRPVAAWSEAAAAKAGEIVALPAPLDRGFRVPDLGATVIAAPDVHGGSSVRPSAGQPVILPMGEVDLRVGDVAVDRDHGLCVFEGLERIPTGDGGSTEALRLRFASEAILMVPVAQADRIWRYGSEEEAVTLDKLDGGTWPKRRLATEAGLARAARAMLEAAEIRRSAKAPALVPPEREMERFGAGFGFPLTPDQARAVDGALQDLAGERPMDRLVCGDVGFGKTEVALRAAAAALLAGKQVAVVAPTTVLVRQHLRTFARRFSRFGIGVAQLSRLEGPAEARRVRQGLADGSIRLVIGTHALAGRGVAFADLGLVVIDEEQRFGAALKERLRGMAGGAQGSGAHLLTLTATPIPRTLQSALVGLKSLSVIATPPAVRQPIRTVLTPLHDDTLRAALMREKGRGGQSFVVCPRIEEIGPMAERLKALVPELTTVVAHGEMKPAELDEVMVRFADGEGDVLLATSIIESGLDVPRANTMLVHDAERFGLAQLHQLRGRVGRGQRRGVTYLLTRPDRELPPAAEKRLRTLEALDRLGAGFAISARDLDLRGAGDLVGENQAGHVKLIGLGLYQHLLQLALRAAKGEPAEDWAPEINLGLSGDVPEDYVPEPEVRLGLYTRLLRLGTLEEVEALRGEVEDRFGPLPSGVRALFALGRLRVGCLQLGIARLTGGPQGLAADVRPGCAPAAMPLCEAMTARDGRLILRRPCDDPNRRADLAAEFLHLIQEARDHQG